MQLKLYNKSYIQSHKGFTLIETLVGITILLFSITATLSMISTNIRFSGAAREKMTASFLAQEALEIVRNIRDTNTYENKNWLKGLTKCINSLCYLDATETRLNDIAQSCEARCPLLKLSNQDDPSQPSVYQYTRGADTIYRREVIIDERVNKVSIQVSATVYWTRGILEKSMTINEYIYNWQGNMKEVEIPRIHLFKASPSKISKGESSLLTWESEDTTDCTIYDPIEDTSYPGLGTIGSLEVYPESTTIYEINCSGATSEVKVGVK